MSKSDGLEFDPQEYADQLGYTDELGRGDHSDSTAVRAETPEERRRGMTRRELLVKGGLGAAAITAAGAFAGSAAAKAMQSGTRGAYTGTLNVISLGVEWPAGAQDQAEKDLGVKFNVQLLSTNAQVQKAITAPDELRHRRSLQLPDVPDLAHRQPAAGRPDEVQGLEPVLPALHQGQGQPEGQEGHATAKATRRSASCSSTRGLDERDRQEHRACR